MICLRTWRESKYVRRKQERLQLYYVVSYVRIGKPKRVNMKAINYCPRRRLFGIGPPFYEGGRSLGKVRMGVRNCRLMICPISGRSAVLLALQGSELVGVGSRIIADVITIGSGSSRVL